MHESLRHTAGSEGTSRAWLEVDLDALQRNAGRLHAHARRPLIAIVKADAYGHGAGRVAAALASWGMADNRLHAFGTATIEEAIALRESFDAIDRESDRIREAIGEDFRDELDDSIRSADDNVGTTPRIMCCTPLLSSELEAARRHAIMPALHHAEEIAWWRAHDGGPWHLSIDTGMQRAGIRWDRVDLLRDIVDRHPPAAVFTHFHSADTDAASVVEQESRFAHACTTLGFDDREEIARHLDNSAAIAARGRSNASYVRPGLALYGGGSSQRLPLEPIATIRARVLDVHEVEHGESVSYNATWRADGTRTVATVGAGYADGYRRAFSNQTRALLHGVPVPIAGRVTMDLTMFDVTGLPCAVGDVVTLMGRDGAVTITPEELGNAGGLSVYELFVGQSLRMPRHYVGGLTQQGQGR
jgi:alanine racemase